METVANTYIPGTVMYETTTAYTPKEFEVALCDACLDRADRRSMRCGVAGGGCALLICTAILAGVATSPVAGPGLRWFAWIFAALLWAFALWGAYMAWTDDKVPNDPSKPRDLSSLHSIAKKQRKPLGFDMVFTPEEWKQFVIEANRSRRNAFFRPLE